MSKSLPPLNWLRAFEAAARHLSFTEAARDLNMTQSAVSQQIKSLEAYLSQPLFHRRARGLELTQTGVTYLPVVRDAFRTLSQGTRAVRGSGPDVVQVHSSLTFALHWLAPRLPRFQEQHPEVRLSLSTEIWEARNMAEGADIEIRFSLRPSDAVRAEFLHKDQYYPVCAPGYRASLDRLHEAQLYDCSNLLANWATWAERQGLEWSDDIPITYCTTFSLSLGVALAGGGLALGHDAIAHDLIKSGHLIAPFQHRAPMQEAYYLIESPQAVNLPGAQAFARWVRREMERFHIDQHFHRHIKPS
jgi:LysR family glycine cleavage system transcriptional activator